MSFWDEEIVKYWGKELVPLPVASVSLVNLPRETFTFLTEKGLPDSGEKSSNLEDMLKIQCYVAADDIEALTSRNQHYLVIGDDSCWSDISIEEETGKVFSIDESASNDVVRYMYVNASIQLYLMFLQIFMENIGVLDETIDETVKEKAPAVIESVKDKFIMLDNTALSDPNNYWSALIQDQNLYYH
jgi:hypothetical protein